MNWESFYLICFLVGLGLSALSLFGVLGRFGGHVHLAHVGHVHAPHAVAGAAHLAGSGARGGGASVPSSVPWWNAFSLMIFLCWFGAAGYLLTRYGSFVALVVLVLAVVCGFAGGAIVFLFLTRVLLPHERELTADETDVVGAVGRLSSAIRAGGVGEMVYEQLGARRSAPARSDDGEPIQKQEEVYVVRYEKGIAYVRRWDDLPEADQGSGVRDQGSGLPPELSSEHRLTDH
jgi:membrane protein implicated in regulation of membrane protease activity